MVCCVLPTVLLTGLLVIAGTAAQQSTAGAISVNGAVLTPQQVAQLQASGVQVAPGAYW